MTHRLELLPIVNSTERSKANIVSILVFASDICVVFNFGTSSWNHITKQNRNETKDELFLAMRPVILAMLLPVLTLGSWQQRKGEKLGQGK